MGSADEIERHIENMSFAAGPELDTDVWSDTARAYDQSEKKNPARNRSFEGRHIMRSPHMKLAAAAVVLSIVGIGLIGTRYNGGQSAYAFEQTVEAMQGKRSFHIQTYVQHRRKDEYWAQFDGQGKLIRFRQEEEMGSDGTIVTLWADGIRSHYYPPPWSIHLMSRVENTGGGLEGLEKFDPETIVQEVHELVADGKAVMEIQDPPRYARLTTIHVTRTDGKPLKQILIVDPVTKFVVRVDNYWDRGEEVFHRGIEVLEYNETIDPELFEADPAEDTITIDQVTQEVGMAQGDRSSEQLACEIIPRVLKAWAVADYAQAGKLFGGAPPELFQREHYRSLQPISIGSIRRPVVIEHTLAVLRVKCTYKVKRGDQVETVSPRFALARVDGQPGRWCVHWLVWPSTEE